MVKFLCDENIPKEVVESIKKDKTDIISITELKYGLDDEEILCYANKERKVLITFDKDFGELIFKQKKKNNGIILIRMHPQSIELISETLRKVLSRHIDFENSFCIVEKEGIRVIPIVENDQKYL